MMKRLVSVIAIAFSIAASGSAIAGEYAGPREAHATIKAKDWHRYQFVFKADEVASLYVQGNGSSNLNCLLMDDEGNDINKDERYIDSCFIRFNPVKTGLYHLKIMNAGNNSDTYTLTTN